MRAYVKGANKTLEKLDEAREKDDFTPPRGARAGARVQPLRARPALALLAEPGARRRAAGPTGALAAAIERDFGSFDAFKKQMNAAAATIMGSGWAALVWEPLGERLLSTQIYDHQSNLAPGRHPLMVLDAWEHAYYLQYENRKTDFFEAVWNLWNWEDVAARFEQAQGK